jgi:hypothetical protein
VGSGGENKEKENKRVSITKAHTAGLEAKAEGSVLVEGGVGDYDRQTQ